MKKSHAFKYGRLLLITLFLLSGGLLVPERGQAQGRDELQLREYTNPDELVRFDRTTSFIRALDVINDFSEEYEGKIILDSSGTTGPIGITVPPMYWKKALDLILRVNGLVLTETDEYYEIIDDSDPAGEAGPGGTGGTSAVPDTALSLDTREVRINAIFFEGNRRALREIGVDWSTLTENVPDEIIELEGEEQAPVPNVFDGPFVQVNSSGASSVSQSVFNSLVNFGEIGGTGIQVQALFSAFEADNLGEIIASPTIRVMDGQEGRVQVGQDFSIKQRDIAGNVIDQFFSVGTILTVTPRIINLGDSTFIHLNIEAERSSAQPDPVSTIINTNEAETQSLLLDGETTAIAGLYRTESAQIRRGIPILKDLPPWFFGLRYLFGYNSDDLTQSELVILIEASIIPSLKERLAQKQLDNKFQVLANERQWIQQEIMDKNKYSEVELPGAGDEDDPLQDPLPEDQPVDSIPGPEEVNPQDSAGEEIETKRDSVTAVPDEVLQDTTEELQHDVEIRQEEIMLDYEEEADTTEAPETVEGPAGVRYYLIGGSFGQRSNAESFRDQLVTEGYDAVILPVTERGLHMVAYRSYTDRQAAVSALADLQQYINAEAWMFAVEE